MARAPFGWGALTTTMSSLVDGLTLTASVTDETVDGLALTEGQSAYAIIKPRA
jgi:molybdopterin-binding protein